SFRTVLLQDRTAFAPTTNCPGTALSWEKQTFFLFFLVFFREVKPNNTPYSHACEKSWSSLLATMPTFVRLLMTMMIAFCARRVCHNSISYLLPLANWLFCIEGFPKIVGCAPLLTIRREKARHGE